MIAFILAYKFLILTCIGASLFLWEYFLDFLIRHEGRMRHVSRNLSFSAVNSLALGLFYASVLTYAESVSIFSLSSLFGEGYLSTIAFYLSAFLLFDMVLYFWHRANHGIPFLWRFHKVHHSDHDLDFSSAVRFHFGELCISTLVKALLIFLIGVPVIIVAFFDVIVTTCAMFNHANISFGKYERYVRFFIVTPDMHRVHHSTDYRETDTNFSTTISLWDYLYKTVCLRKDQENINIGLKEFPRNTKVVLSKLFTIPFK